MAKGKTSGIVTTIGLLCLFGICVFLTPALLIAGMMGASDAPGQSSTLTKTLLVFGLPVAPWIFFVFIAAAALRKAPQQNENDPEVKVDHKSQIIGITLFILFVILWFKF